MARAKRKRKPARVIDFQAWKAKRAGAPEVLADTVAARNLIRAVLEWPARWSEHTIATAVRNVAALVSNDLNFADIVDVLDEYGADVHAEGP
jgi:hypothetical protein